MSTNTWNIIESFFLSFFFSFSGGTFALYSLICRYAKVTLIPNQQVEDHDISNYPLQLSNRRQKRASWLMSKLEKRNFAKSFLLFATMLGTSMVIEWCSHSLYLRFTIHFLFIKIVLAKPCMWCICSSITSSYVD